MQCVLHGCFCGRGAFCSSQKPRASSPVSLLMHTLILVCSPAPNTWKRNHSTVSHILYRHRENDATYHCTSDRTVPICRSVPTRTRLVRPASRCTGIQCPERTGFPSTTTVGIKYEDNIFSYYTLRMSKIRFVIDTRNIGILFHTSILYKLLTLAFNRNVMIFERFFFFFCKS